MVRLFAFAAAALAMIAAPASAPAGVLSKVVDGMKRHAGKTDDDSDDDGGGASAADDSRGWDDGYNAPYQPGDTGRWADPTEPVGVFYGPHATSARGTDVQIYAGLQSVAGSDGSATFALRSSYDGLGIAVSDTRYYERVPTMGGGTDYLTLDVWTIGASYRAVRFGRGDRSAVWLQGGLAGANTDDLSVFGVTAGVEIAHDVSRHLGVSGGTRVLMHQHDIHGLEVRAGLAASIVRLSYRVLKLNTGPALRGPEFGLALQF